MTMLNINGAERSVDAPPDTPLLWVLRDSLHLCGTKFGCGMGLCGACTVHLEGAAVRSCQLPLAAVAGKRITTIEGLGTPESLHAVQAAWRDEDVPQCGYCQSGQIMSAAALLATTRTPSDSDIDAAMAGRWSRLASSRRCSPTRSTTGVAFRCRRAARRRPRPSLASRARRSTFI